MEGKLMPRWIIVTNYPKWPSPYFSQFESSLLGHLPYEFKPHIPGPLELRSGDIVNLHRLKRLYVGETGVRTEHAAHNLLDKLTGLREIGAKIVWTLHNPYPIDGGPVTDTDIWVTKKVLELADHVIVHTDADASGARQLGRTGPITVAGWAGMPTRAVARNLDKSLVPIVDRMKSTEFPVLMLGNWTTYKDIPAVIRATRDATSQLGLFVLGPCRDNTIRQQVAFEERRTPSNRLVIQEGRVAPEHLYSLFGAARACVCNYNTSGDHWFFKKVLHPSSVSSAVVFGLPLIAPALEGVVEISNGHARSLYEPDDWVGEALQQAEHKLTQNAWTDVRPSFDKVVEDDRVRWKQIVGNYVQVMATLYAEI